MTSTDNKNINLPLLLEEKIICVILGNIKINNKYIYIKIKMFDYVRVLSLARGPGGTRERLLLIWPGVLQ